MQKHLINNVAILLAFICCIFRIFVLSQSILELGSLVIIGNLLFNIILLFLLVFRKPETEFNSNFDHFSIVILVHLLPIFFKSSYSPKLIWIFAPLWLLGFSASCLSLAFLGNKIGVLASNKGLQTGGIYQFVRHPLYLGELAWFLSTTLAHSCTQNFLVFFAILLCQIKRIHDEEQILANNTGHSEYVNSVKYKLIPGLY